MQYIKKLKLTNFKKFRNLEIQLDKELNTLIGDNESGKSSILQAIEIISSGSRYKIEYLGLDAILNKEVVNEFLAIQRKKFENLPELHAEIFLAKDDQDLNGKYNTDNIEATGLHLMCIPDDELIKEINDALINNPDAFPYEFYKVSFLNFRGESYTSYRRALRTLLIDNTQINTKHANNEYIKKVFEATTSPTQRALLNYQYRTAKKSFKSNQLSIINNAVDNYSFDVRSGAKYNLEEDLTLTKDSVPLEHRGKGQQCFVKTDFALSRNKRTAKIEVLLIEEPENHLSFSNMHKLINNISGATIGQKIIATHSSLVSTRLDLRKSFLLGPNNLITPMTLKNLSEDTAKFFMKAPNNNFLEFALSKKVILVEGDAEYMLLDALYRNVTGNSYKSDRVTIISVGGTSFKRYMEVAKELNIKTAVIIDNDGNFQKNCIERFNDYIQKDLINIFYDDNDNRYTLEVCIFKDNESICKDLFGKSTNQMKSMLNNKSEAAFRLVDKHKDNINAPDHIKKAIQWIKE